MLDPEIDCVETISEISRCEFTIDDNKTIGTLLLEGKSRQWLLVIFLYRIENMLNGFLKP